MATGIIVFFVVMIGIGVFFYKSFKKPEFEDISEREDFVENFDEEFFKRTQAGETYQLFLSISSQRDCAIIRSLLSADNIPTYVEGEHMNNIYGGIAGTMNAVVAVKLYVLSNDYDRALEIAQDFVQKKAEKLGEEDSKTSEKLMAGLGAVFGVPGAFISSQEFLGITFWPKVEAKAD